MDVLLSNVQTEGDWQAAFIAVETFLEQDASIIALCDGKKKAVSYTLTNDEGEQIKQELTARVWKDAIGRIRVELIK